MFSIICVEKNLIHDISRIYIKHYYQVYYQMFYNPEHKKSEITQQSLERC